MTRMDNKSQEIIYTKETCVGCNKCIKACPTLGANVAVTDETGKNKILVDQSKCIRCGRCIGMCSHGSRAYYDDTPAFFRDLQRSNNISMIIAPAFYTNYSKNYKRVLGYLKSLGVANFYSVSFGADITTWAYLNYIQQKGEAGLISQPCPAIVNYIEMYQPELLKKLIPVQSPMMCTAIYVKKYLGINDTLAFLSPCIAKKNEINDPNNFNYVSYNVTFNKLMEHIAGVDLSQYPEVDDVIDYGMGSVYPMPGGLRENVEYYIGHEAFVSQIEGEDHAYPYLANYAKQLNHKTQLAALIDALNCRRGCNFGTGTENNHSLEDDVLYNMHKIRAARSGSNQLRRIGEKKTAGPSVANGDNMTPAQRFAIINDKFKALTLSDFLRKYDSLPVDEPQFSDQQLLTIMYSMNKHNKEEQSIDCSSCGYKSCHDMAQAIACNYNNRNNCIHYMKSTILEEQQEIEAKNDEIHTMLSHQLEYVKEVAGDFGNINQVLSNLSQENQKSACDARKISQNVKDVFENANEIEQTLEEIKKKMESLKGSSDEVVAISRRTNMLSLNASIEAARAGTYGKGFGVVADEVRSLAQLTRNTANKSKENTDTIIAVIEQMVKKINQLVEYVENANVTTGEIAIRTNDIEQQTGEILSVTNRLLEKYNSNQEMTVTV